MSESSSQNNRPSSSPTQPASSKIQEKNLEKMEALISQSAMGIHVLFDNSAIAEVMSQPTDEKDFYNFDKMKKVQDVMTELIAKKTFFEKTSYLRDLDSENFSMLVRTYFHIVENSIRNNQH